MAAVVTVAAAAPPPPTPCSPAPSPVRMTRPPLGSSVVCGSRYADRIYARGNTVFAFAGNDVVYARNRRVDDIRGGLGRDLAYVDRVDRVYNVERVIRR